MASFVPCIVCWSPNNCHPDIQLHKITGLLALASSLIWFMHWNAKWPGKPHNLQVPGRFGRSPLKINVLWFIKYFIFCVHYIFIYMYTNKFSSFTRQGRSSARFTSNKNISNNHNSIQTTQISPWHRTGKVMLWTHKCQLTANPGPHLAANDG